MAAKLVKVQPGNPISHQSVLREQGEVFLCSGRDLELYLANGRVALVEEVPGEDENLTPDSVEADDSSDPNSTAAENESTMTPEGESTGESGEGNSSPPVDLGPRPEWKVKMSPAQYLEQYPAGPNAEAAKAVLAWEAKAAEQGNTNS